MENIRDKTSIIMCHIDLHEGKIDIKLLENRQNISFLLGSGFSIPKGYPIRKNVNEKLLNFDYNHFGISPAGELYKTDIIDSEFSNHYQRNLDFCHRIIDTYTEKHQREFDYEKFFDFIHSEEINKTPYRECAEGLFEGKEDYYHLVEGLDDIFNQMVEFIITDKDGNIWYDNEPNYCGSVDEYDTLLKIISAWSNDYIVNIHTLNHDMLFESFNKRDYIAGKICDGFNEYGSEYFGEITINKSRKYTVRLEQYTGEYDKPVRLYKLHGSFDYVFFYRSEGLFLYPDKCIKTRYGIDIKSLKKDVMGEKKYERFPFTYHGYYLSGNKTKVKQYNKLFFENIHEIFHSNLKSAEKLIIIGYGGLDKGINKAIFDNYDYQEKQTIIIDPYPSEMLKKFAKKIGAKIIEKSVSNIVKEEVLEIH